MVIYIGADHRGFELKEYLKGVIKDRGYELVDVGNSVLDQSDDYPDFARAVAEKVSSEYEQARGILLCGSGVGVDVVANKIPRIRCALASTPDQAYDSRNDDDANVLALPASHISPETARKIVTTWLETPFSREEQHVRRIKKIAAIEDSLAQSVKEESEKENHDRYSWN